MRRRREEIETRLSIPDVPPPPADLLHRLKREIPHTLGAPPKRRPDTIQAGWRVAASVLLLVGFSYLAVRIIDDYEQREKALSPAAESRHADGVVADWLETEERAADEAKKVTQSSAPANASAPAPGSAARATAPPPPPPSAPLSVSAAPQVARERASAKAEARTEAAKVAELSEEDAEAGVAAGVSGGVEGGVAGGVVGGVVGGDIAQQAPAAASPSPAPEPAPQRAGEEPVRVGGNVDPPVVIYRVDPVFTDAMSRTQIKPGVFIAELHIDRAGGVKNVRILRGVEGLPQGPVVSALRGWKFRPARSRATGEPVGVLFNVSVPVK